MSDGPPGSGAPGAGGPPLVIPADLEATLVLVRHGESELIVERRFQGRLETPLSPTGRRQAELVGARLARPHDRPALPVPGSPPLAIVHSPLGRAAQTAEAIGRAIAGAAGADEGSSDGSSDESSGRSGGGTVPLRSDEAFLEIGQGDWEGRLSADIQANDGERLAAWRRMPTRTWAPGGEPLADVRARVVGGLDRILAELAAAGRPGSIHAPQVAGYRDGEAHGDQPWTILVGHDGVFKVALLALFDLPLERFWMWSSELCGISVVEVRAGRPVVRAMNLTDHLVALGDEEDQAEAEARARSGAL